ncbi:MAG: helix-hairpin-helix domain-containing protein [Bacteroidales bacterium]
MKRIIESISDWLGYTRGERRASLILLLLIVIVIVTKSLIPSRAPALTIIPVDEKPETINKKLINGEEPVKSTRVQNRRYLTIELNTCDSASLVSLPGIGPVLSSRIIRFRKLLGGFVSITQLNEVYGLKPETYKLIEGRITVDSLIITRIFINEADYKELVRHPYLEPADVRLLLEYRKLQGSIRSFEDIVKNNLVDSSRIYRIKPYLRYNR